jgi:hypothetical protein
LDGWRLACKHRIEAVGTDVLNRSRAILTDLLEEREWRVRTNAVALSPASENISVVGK